MIVYLAAYFAKYINIQLTNVKFKKYLKIYTSKIHS